MKNNLKKLRADRNISQLQLSQISGVSQQTISKIELEEEGYSPKHDTLVSIGNALGVHLDEITKVK